MAARDGAIKAKGAGRWRQSDRESARQRLGGGARVRSHPGPCGRAGM